MCFSKIIIAVPLLMLGAPVFSASACHVQYQKIGSTLWTTKTAQQGTLMTINVSTIHKIINLGPNKVVRTASPASPGVLTMNNGMVETFPLGTKFIDFNCTGDNGTQSISTFIATMKNNQINLSILARQVQLGFNKAAEDVVKILIDAKFPVPEVVQVMKSQFNASGGKTAIWLKNAGVPTYVIADHLKSDFSATGSQMAGWLKEANVTIDEITGELIRNYQPLVSDLAKWLYDAGFTLNHVAISLKNKLSINLQAEMSVLRKLDGKANNVVTAIRIAFSDASINKVIIAMHATNYSVDDAGIACVEVFRVGATEAVATLKAAGYSAREAAVFLVRNSRLAGQLKYCTSCTTAAQKITMTIHKIYNTDLYEMAVIMRKVGLYAKPLAQALQVVYSAGFAKIETALRKAGYSAAEINDAIKSLK